MLATSPAAAAQYLLTHVFYPFDMTIRMAELFKKAMKVNAPELIFSHCRPSGEPNPSPEDVQVTRTVYQAGQLLGVELVDHIVVGRDCWISLKERGLGFE
ncbi:MAG: hypothetical protein HYR94_27745 [Chloroflexi bacterium]|nr:hypothetical protein [Chloroflexota bacterium]